MGKNLKLINMENVDFDFWWFNGGSDKAEVRYYYQAKENVKKELSLIPKFIPENDTAIDNHLEVEYNNIISNEMERLAKENNMHLS